VKVDDDTLEVTRLRDGAPGLRAPERAGSWQARRGQRHRLALTLLSAGLVALTLLALLALTQPDPWATVEAYLHLRSTAPQAPSNASGSELFYVRDEVPWGKLTVDQQSIYVADLTQAQQTDGTASHAGLSFALRSGKHTLTYDAPPFALLRCTVSVPAARGDTCPLATPNALEQGIVSAPALVIELGATVDRLPAAEQVALEASARDALALPQQPTRVAPGERYLGADGTLRTAAQELRAVAFREPWDGLPLEGSSGGCVFLCAMPEGAPVPVGSWVLQATVRLGYRYLALDGQTVDEGPLASERSLGPTWTGHLPADLGAQRVALRVEVLWYRSAWNVVLVESSPQPLLCDTGSGLTAALMSGSFASPAPLPATNPTAGCLVGIFNFAGNGAASSQILLLYRFGVLLAIDAAGHNRFPTLLLATPDEQALARQIIASH